MGKLFLPMDLAALWVDVTDDPKTNALINLHRNGLFGVHHTRRGDHRSSATIDLTKPYNYTQSK